jgi:hypothetical protein
MYGEIEMEEVYESFKQKFSHSHRCWNLKFYKNLKHEMQKELIAIQFNFGRRRLRGTAWGKIIYKMMNKVYETGKYPSMWKMTLLHVI